MRGAEHVKCTRDNKDTIKITVGTLKERDYLEGLGINGRIILKGVLKYITWA
jgi:hypothetical protein